MSAVFTLFTRASAVSHRDAAHCTGRGIVSGMMDDSRQLGWAQPGQQRHKNIAKKVEESACTAALSVINLF